MCVRRKVSLKPQVLQRYSTWWLNCTKTNYLISLSALRNKRIATRVKGVKQGRIHMSRCVNIFEMYKMYTATITDWSCLGLISKRANYLAQNQLGWSQFGVLLYNLSKHTKCDSSWSILPVQSSFIGSPVHIWLHVSGPPSPPHARTHTHSPHRSHLHSCKVMLFITLFFVRCSLKYFSMPTVLV